MLSQTGGLHSIQSQMRYKNDTFLCWEYGVLKCCNEPISSVVNWCINVFKSHIILFLGFIFRFFNETKELPKEKISYTKWKFWFSSIQIFSKQKRNMTNLRCLNVWAMKTNWLVKIESLSQSICERITTCSCNAFHFFLWVKGCNRKLFFSCWSFFFFVCLCVCVCGYWVDWRQSGMHIAKCWLAFFEWFFSFGVYPCAVRLMLSWLVWVIWLMICIDCWIEDANVVCTLVDWRFFLSFWFAFSSLFVCVYVYVFTLKLIIWSISFQFSNRFSIGLNKCEMTCERLIFFFFPFCFVLLFFFSNHECMAAFCLNHTEYKNKILFLCNPTKI